MTVTPKKGVHWDINDISLSELGSPQGNETVDSVISGSTLDYVNSQLLAHGFVTAPGISLHGTSSEDAQQISKCFLTLLGQRMEDMSRTEELSTKYRTLSYDHERLRRLHRSATEHAAHCDGEVNLHKSRLAAAMRAAQASELGNKQTTAELQRTRMVVQGIRATHQAELRKREKEYERMAEKMLKVADAQGKLLHAPSGIRCANMAVVEGSEVLGKGQGFLEISLEQAEAARKHLGEENHYLRKMILTMVNEIQSVLYRARQGVAEGVEEPSSFTLATLFPMYPSTLANEKVVSVLSGLRECLSHLSEPRPEVQHKCPPAVTDEEVKRLEDTIANLNVELDQSRRRTAQQASETQAMFDKFIEDHRNVTSAIGEMSVELLSSPLKDDERARIDRLRKELDDERKNFTDAAVKLGREKAALGAERRKVLDEKRSWEMEKMLAELPPTPIPDSPEKGGLHLSPRKAARKSPFKAIPVGKASGRKSNRVSRRSLATPDRVTPAYETAVLPPLPPPSFQTISPLPPNSFLPTTFVLPPPSPCTSLPTSPPLSSLISSPELQVASPTPQETIPSTPVISRRPFPVAKPFAQRMVHAYSPIKPSPLSRILMLSRSPTSPESMNTGDAPNMNPLDSILEEEAGGQKYGEGISTPYSPVPTMSTMSLAAELGIESPDIHLSQEAANGQDNERTPVALSTGHGTTKERIIHPVSYSLDPNSAGMSKTGAIVGLPRRVPMREKENNGRKSMLVVKAKGPTTALRTNAAKRSTTRIISKTQSSLKPSSTARTRATAVLPTSNNNGPRNMLTDGTDARNARKARWS